MIPHSRPSLGLEEADAVSRVVLSGHIAQGKQVRKFEEEFAAFLGVTGSIAVNSGTSALHLALLALGTNPGDEVIVPDYVCTALLNAVNYTGAIPVVVDVNDADGNLDCQAAAGMLGPRTKAVIVPHMFGRPASGIDLLRKRGVPVIEDCAQTLGTSIDGRRIGTIGDLSIFSFYATKVMTCGEGGMVAGNNHDLLAAVADLRDYDNRSDYKLRYNCKMTDIQAAMGLVQLGKLPGFISRRREIAQMYNNGLQGMPVKIPDESPEGGSIYFRYVIRLAEQDSMLEWLRKCEISAARPVFKPYQVMLPNSQACPTSLRLWQESISLPIFPVLEDEDVAKVVSAIESFYSIDLSRK